MRQAYYKTNEPAVLEAVTQHDEARRTVNKKIEEFAKLFGGEPYTNFSLHSGYRFIGLQFDPPKNSPLWTKPDPRDSGMQRPRVSIQGATLEQKAALAALKAQWQPPQDRAPVEPMLKAMGTSSGDMLFTGPVSMFLHDGHLWIMTSVKLAPFMAEVLASEFHAARELRDALDTADLDKSVPQ